jgi:DNA-binding transcriptional ArsR family regulator
MISGMSRMPTTADAFNAIAEPRRREILDHLAAAERPVNELVELTGLGQPQVSKHLRVLREVRAVQAREEGRRRLYRVDAEALRPVFDWVSRYQRLWEERFEQLDDVLDEMKKEERGDVDDRRT